MNQEIKEQWLANLRSGKYQKVKSLLGLGDNKRCAMGVLCEIAANAGVTKKEDKKHVIYFGDLSGTVPEEVIDWSGIHPSDIEVIVQSNDRTDKSFLEIADYIEKEVD